MSDCTEKRAVTNGSAWLFQTLCTCLLAFTLITSAPNAARADVVPPGHATVDAWVAELNAASTVKDMDLAAAIMTGPLLNDMVPELTTKVAELLTRSFAKTGFQADTIAVLSSGEKGERRLLVIYHETAYRFVFVVMHKRESGWHVININLEGSYDKIREKF